MPYSDDDSQSGFAGDQSGGLSKAELRKTNKPIMEKKRRARINNCLNELKDLLMDATDKDPTRHSKLEKADILELTVKHLQTLHRQQLAAAIAADPAVLHRFRSGFGDCAVEVRRYLSRLASVPTGLRHRLGTHLNTCISGIERLNPLPNDNPPLVPDPLRLDDERPSAFHFVKGIRPTSPPLSPISCDSACDSSTELETPPRPMQKITTYPTPPSRSASDQDSSPETQKPTVSSTTISPETLRQESLKNKKLMEPLSIVIDVENYKIGIDASPKRAVDYSTRNKLKRPVVEVLGPVPKLFKLDNAPERSISLEKTTTVTISERTFYDRAVPPLYRLENKLSIPESIPSTVEISIPSTVERSIPPVERSIPFTMERSIPSIMERNLQSTVERAILIPRPVPIPRTVISHTAESLAQSSRASTSVAKEKIEADTSNRSPEQGSSSSSERMWRPW